MIPSPQQQAIFDWFKRGTGNLIVRARAGPGKTTTIVAGVDYASEARVLVCAFNKRMQLEIAGKLKCPRAEAKTLHSVISDEVVLGVHKLVSLAKNTMPRATAEQLVDLAKRELFLVYDPDRKRSDEEEKNGRAE